MTKSNSVEKQYIAHYSGWDGDVEVMQFYDCRLCKDIGPYVMGTTLRLVELWYMSSEVHIYATDAAAQSGTPTWRGKMGLVFSELTE
jgi:hypothetical protein